MENNNNGSHPMHSHTASSSTTSSTLSQLHSLSGSHGDVTKTESPDSSTIGAASAAGVKRKEPPSTESPMSATDRNRLEFSAQSQSTSPPVQPGSATSQGEGSGSANGSANRIKRVKTARACDSCRRKKIRCDVIQDGPPQASPDNGNDGLICVHCQQYHFECTFFLPITETRFKKKRELEAQRAAMANGPPNMHAMQPNMVPAYAQQQQQHHALSAPTHISASQEWPKPPAALWGATQWRGPGPEASGSSSHTKPFPSNGIASAERRLLPSASKRSQSPQDTEQPPDSRVLGPTSIAYIVHSTAFVPGAAIEAHDIKHHQTFEVGTSGDGIIKFHKPPKGPPSQNSDDDEGFAHIPDSLRGRLAGDVAEKLVNTYFEKIGPLFPVITKSEFLHLSPPPPLLLYSICGIAALSREVPREVLGAVKTTLATLFRENDVLSNSSSVTIRALLVLSLHSDIHGSTAVQSGTRCWNRTGTAIRMAQDLGLHRDASGRDDMDDDAFFLEQKRRIWGCCVTADRCVAISLGHPLTIDLTDCDVRLPSSYEILRYPNDPPSDPNVTRPFAYNTEMLKLSILFGRVMKSIYSPTGLMKATDEEMQGLLDDIDRWRESLPVELRFTGPNSPAPAGILHVSFACLQMLFFRVFMRISYVCPTHLSFSLTIERMTSLIKYSSEAIDWVDRNDFYLDTLQFLSYALVFCATVQYHSYFRRGEDATLQSLRKVRDCMNRFAHDVSPQTQQDLTLRAKTAEVISLLYEAAVGAPNNSNISTGHLNPTAGVSNRRTRAELKGLVFKPDASRPGGGVFVSTDKQSGKIPHLPKGTVVDVEQVQPMLVRASSDHSNGGWQLVPGFPAVPGGDGSAAPGIPGSGPPQDGSAANGAIWFDAHGRPVRGNALQPHPGMLSTPAASLGALNSGSANGAGSGPHDASANQPSSRRLSNIPAQYLTSDPAMNVNPLLNDASSWGPVDYIFEAQPQFAFGAGVDYGGGGAESGAGANAGGDGNAHGNGATNEQHQMQQSFMTPGIDPLLLDGMPGAPFDFDVWADFFSRAGSTKARRSIPNEEGV